MRHPQAPLPSPALAGPRPAWIRRAWALALWALVVLALHGIVLAGWPLGRSEREPAPAPRTLQVRQLTRAMPAPPSLAPALAPSPSPPTAALVPTPPPPPRPRAKAQPEAAAQAPPPPPPPLAAAAVEAVEAGDAGEGGAAAAPVVLHAAAALAPTPAAADDPPPTYRTRMPPSAALRYALRRGGLSGQGVLRWQHDAAGYELTMEGTVFGLQVLAQHSAGGLDAAGLAPQRFVDQRRGRAALAANFQRDRGVITYSGSTAQQPLVAGAQDRLSWMVQLAAIVDAEPQRWRAGAQIEMEVSGARGDADVWTFTVDGREAVELGSGARVDSALVLRREPRKPYDTRVAVWLDPARHHLPVRMQLSGARADEALVFVLEP